MTIHWLKTWPEYFEAVCNQTKTFEVRLNDRNFEHGDLLILEEYDNFLRRYTGRTCAVFVQYRLNGPDFGIKEGYCCMGLYFPDGYTMVTLGEQLKQFKPKE